MKTLLNNDIPEGTKGLVYLCDYDYSTRRLTPLRAVFFENEMDALDFYANTPNPPSQLAMTSEEHTFEEEIEILHEEMCDPEWQEQLADTL